MTYSVFDTFKIGIGPSSSHTVGPMIAARNFALGLRELDEWNEISRVKVDLYGSLGSTGWGHQTGSAVVLGLEGSTPAGVDAKEAPGRVMEIRKGGVLHLLADDPGEGREIRFEGERDVARHGATHLPFHPNAMKCRAWAHGKVVAEEIWYSIGGGTVVKDDGTGQPELPKVNHTWPYSFRRAADLVDLCNDNEMTIPDIMMANECSQRPRDEVEAKLDEIWRVMSECIDSGCATSGTLPGGLFVLRRAPQLYKRICAQQAGSDSLAVLDEVTLWALAVNEENAAGGRMVTAPTNGAAGVIPAVMKYAVMHLPGEETQLTRDFLLVAGAIGSVFKTTASISGAEVGCQGEVGTACSMAAGALTYLQGGTSQQVTNAAEIGLEHHLGLTCDPVAGLVQIPCIERNAIAAVKAITAARLAIADDGYQKVTLDQCIRTMMTTGLDMKSKYKETAEGGLAVNIIEC